MAFNADDIWEFPAAAVVAASTIQHRVKQIRERSCKQPSSSVRSEPLGVLLQPPGIAVAAAAHATGLPIPPGAAQVPRPGQASLPTFSDCSADKWFLFRRAYTVCCQINNWDATATGLPSPQGAAQEPRPGQASLPTFSNCSADGWFLFRRAVK
jgi:hypothetical protein